MQARWHEEHIGTQTYMTRGFARSGLRNVACCKVGYCNKAVTLVNPSMLNFILLFQPTVPAGSLIYFKPGSKMMQNTKKHWKEWNMSTKRINYSWKFYPVDNDMFEVNNRNSRTWCEICSKLTIKTPEWRHWSRSDVFIVNFEHISYFVLTFVLLTLSM